MHLEKESLAKGPCRSVPEENLSKGSAFPMPGPEILHWKNLPFLFVHGERTDVDNDEILEDERTYDRDRSIWLIAQERDLVPLVLCNNSAPGTKTMTRSFSDEDIDD
jgi:hypothetical protein